MRVQIVAQLLYHLLDNRQRQATLQQSFDEFLKIGCGHGGLTDTATHQGCPRLTTQKCNDG